MNSLADTMSAMTDVARMAGARLMELGAECSRLRVDVKGAADFVTNADKEAESIIHGELARRFPGYGFLLEESGHFAGEGTRSFLVDPLGATTNFLKGIPLWGISIALKDGPDVLAGVIYFLVLGELFSAVKGGGAYLNGMRLAVSSCTHLNRAVIATGLHGRRGANSPEWLAERVRRIVERTAGIRRAGCTTADLAWVARGTCRSAEARLMGKGAFGRAPNRARPHPVNISNDRAA